MYNRENKGPVADTGKEKVAATQGVAQPRPIASAAQTAAGAIAERIASRAQGGSQRDKNEQGR